MMAHLTAFNGLLSGTLEIDELRPKINVPVPLRTEASVAEDFCCSIGGQDCVVPAVEFEFKRVLYTTDNVSHVEYEMIGLPKWMTERPKKNKKGAE